MLKPITKTQAWLHKLRGEQRDLARRAREEWRQRKRWPQMQEGQTVRVKLPGRRELVAARVVSVDPHLDRVTLQSLHMARKLME